MCRGNTERGKLELCLSLTMYHGLALECNMYQCRVVPGCCSMLCNPLRGAAWDVQSVALRDTGKHRATVRSLTRT